MATTHDRDRARLTARREIGQLDDEALAHRLVVTAELPRSIGTHGRYALLYTAAIRLRMAIRRIGSTRRFRVDAEIVDGFGPLVLEEVWMSGDLPQSDALPKGGRWELVTGNGMGNPNMRLIVRDHGGFVVRTETIDWRPVARMWVGAAAADLPVRQAAR